MSKEIFKIIFEEFKKNGIKLNDFEYRGDTFVSDPLDIANFPILRGEDMRPLLDFSEHDKPFEDKIAELEKRIQELDTVYAIRIDEKRALKQRIAELENEKTDSKHSLNEMEKIKSHWIDRAVEWQQKCEKLEGEKSENFEEKTISDDTRPSAEWYENRYQQDCITINRLNTTIDVLIHKIEHLRQFAGLE